MRGACAILAAAVLLHEASFAAEWISASEPRNDCDATYFVAVATNAGEVIRAEWRVSGLGVFQAFVNGREIGGFLKPGFTHVQKCRHVYAKDVTGLMNRAAGAVNVLSATVTAGWWRDGVVEDVSYDRLPFEDELNVPDAVLGAAGRLVERFVADDADNAFWGELVCTYADGSKSVFGTGPRWRAARVGAVRAASIYGGETYDARIDECAWCAADCGLFSTENDLRRFEAAVAADPRMRPLFEKQTPPALDRAFSFGLNILPSGEAYLRSATGREMRLKPIN